MKFMNAVSPSRSRSGPHGSSSETGGSAKASGAWPEADAGCGGAAPTDSDRGSSAAKDANGGGATGAADSGSGSGSASDVGGGSDGAASAGGSADSDPRGSAGAGETVGARATEASGGDRSFIAACPVREARQP